jgi:hypothetical protein
MNDLLNEAQERDQDVFAVNDRRNRNQMDGSSDKDSDSGSEIEVVMNRNNEVMTCITSIKSR